MAFRSLVETEKLVCLCGHQRHRVTFDSLSNLLTQEGYVVISILNEPASPDAEKTGDESENWNAWAGVSAVNKRKIELCEALVVLNIKGYIDECTRNQINYAYRLGKAVHFAESADYNPLTQGEKRILNSSITQHIGEDVPTLVEEGAVLDISVPFKVHAGAVLLYGPDSTRPAFTLVADHVWPGIQWVPEVWHAEAVSQTYIASFSGEGESLRLFGELIRWGIASGGEILERVLWGLAIIGSVSTQEELSAVIGCRRESVTMALSELRKHGLVEKVEGRIRLTTKGLTCASKLSSLDRDEEQDLLGWLDEVIEAVPVEGQGSL